MRILVTNDDGIDSVGLHRLAVALTEHGEVTVVAPDQEYSGASAAIGAIWDLEPVIRRRSIEGVPAAWTLNGPPALCVLWSKLGIFGEDEFDLVVSGINPGANIGRSVYYSGTVGACISARNIGISGVAVSQKFASDFEGQAIADIVANQVWDTAAHIAAEFVGGMIEAGLPEEPAVINMNVPNVPIGEITGWQRTEVGLAPAGASSTAELEPIDGDPDAYSVKLDWGPFEGSAHGVEGTDTHAVSHGLVSISYLSRFSAEQRDDLGAAEGRLTGLFAR